MQRRSKQPPWKIKVARKAEVLAEFEIPAHKMGRHEVGIFLRALMIRYRTETPQEMAAYYVNGRRGAPERLPFADVGRAWSEDQEEQGYFCGNWDCYATAMVSVGPDVARATRALVAENKRASAKE